MPGTLIIGDETANALYNAISATPGVAGGIWEKYGTGANVHYWATASQDDIQAILEDIAGGTGAAQAPATSSLPDKILVALGRRDILMEPGTADPAQAQALAADVSDLVNKLLATKLRVLWIMPPLAQNEGSYRDVITKALAAKNIRVFQSRGMVDPASRGKIDGSPPPIAPETYKRMAQLLQVWVPLGPYIGTITPREAQAQDGSGGFGGHIAQIPSDVGGWWSGLSTGRKVGYGLGLAAIIGGAAYLGKRRYG